jgi:hypothetical protein
MTSEARLTDLDIIEAVGRYLEDTAPAPILSAEEMYVGAMSGFSPAQAAAILLNAESRRQLMETWDTFKTARRQRQLPSIVERIMGEEAAGGTAQWHVILANETGHGNQWLEPGWAAVLATLPAPVRDAMAPDLGAGSVPAYEWDPASQGALALARGEGGAADSGWDASDWDRSLKVADGMLIGLKQLDGSLVVGLWCASPALSGFYDLTLTWPGSPPRTVERLEATAGVTTRRGGLPCPGGVLPADVTIRVARA